MSLPVDFFFPSPKSPMSRYLLWKEKVRVLPYLGVGWKRETFLAIVDGRFEVTEQTFVPVGSISEERFERNVELVDKLIDGKIEELPQPERIEL